MCLKLHHLCFHWFESNFLWIEHALSYKYIIPFCFALLFLFSLNFCTPKAYHGLGCPMPTMLNFMFLSIRMHFMLSFME